VRNAIDARPHGHVRVVASLEGTMSSSPSGRWGEIPDEVKPRIFDLYFTTKREGTDVSLAVAHQVVSSHRGGSTCRIVTRRQGRDGHPWPRS
jgi:signal transduction histidine kinase